MEITCPSGLAGRVRKFRVSDTEITSDSHLAKEGRVITRLCESIWTETTSPGPYTLDAAGKVPWGKVAAADRIYVLVQTRLLTHGPDYDLQVGCAGCNSPITHRVDLSTLESLPMDSTMRAALAGGEPLSQKLPDGRVVKYRTLVGDDDRFIMNVAMTSPQRLILMALFRRIVSIEGVADHPNQLLVAVQELDEDVATGLREAVERLEGGYDLAVEVVCARCGTFSRHQIPFDRNFFAPRRFSRPSTAPSSSTP